MYDAILVPTDGSEGATAAGEHALDLAARYDATVHVLYVVDVRMSPISTGMDREAVIDLLEEDGGTPTATLCERAAEENVPAVEAIRIGVPHEGILEYVDEYDVDLIVMGTHGRTGLEHTLLGSVTERVIRTVDVPVMAVQQEPN